MAKLTRKQQSELFSVLRNAERAQEFLLQDRIVVARVRSEATTTIDYTRKADDRVICEIAKEVGSDLCGLFQATRSLKQFIEKHAKSPPGDCCDGAAPI